MGYLPVDAASAAVPGQAGSLLGPDVEKARADFGPLANAPAAGRREHASISSKLTKPHLLLLPVNAPDGDWPEVRRYRLVRLRGESLPREDREKRLRTPPYE